MLLKIFHKIEKQNDPQLILWTPFSLIPKQDKNNIRKETVANLTWEYKCKNPK